MDGKSLKEILDLLPIDQRQSAKSRITTAELCGWQFVQLWDWGLLLNEMDLVGFDQNGDFDFLK